ncbi:HBL/NHE enterotoxin family protein [Bacillus wiedmannii]|uniref:HBL/NHE enterotoxin family protein n=1 Tax=Bacillus wiedmannii TaxID=1890302 RepID=UPI000BF23ED8|nr:HBL/NHE enterotoxin family protein [Bacillus wiedmannii]PEJ73707.1 hypothetical protein CN685_11105 [Bacillus wiedmannii]
MSSIKRILLLCCTLIGSIPICSPSSPIFADSKVPTVMDGLTADIIALHPSFAGKIVGAKETNIAPDVLDTTVNHEISVYQQAQSWQETIKPKLENTQNQILSYNVTFHTIYEDIQKGIQVKNKQQILASLQTLQNDITSKKTNVTDFLTIIRNFKSDIAKSSQQLQTDIIHVQASMDGYKQTLDSLYAQLENTTSDEVRKHLEDESADISVKLYDKLEPLRNHLTTVKDKINGVNDGVLNLGLLNSLEDMNTNWTTLESKLQSLIQNIEDSSDVNPVFITDDIAIVKNTWDTIYKLASNL